MTTRDLIRLLFRRWYVIAAGALVSLLVAVATLHRPPVYFTQFDVVLLPPPQAVQNNSLRTDPFGLSAAAGMLVEEFNHGKHPLDMSTTLTTLYGEGQYSGYRVRMRNEGNQWQPVYPDPVIDVQVVDPDAAVVVEQAHRIVADLAALLRRRQDAITPPTPLRITLQQASSDPVIYRVGSSRMRAAGGLALLSGSLTLVAVIWFDRIAGRWRRSAAAELIATTS